VTILEFRMCFIFTHDFFRKSFASLCSMEATGKEQSKPLAPNGRCSQSVNFRQLAEGLQNQRMISNPVHRLVSSFHVFFRAHNSKTYQRHNYFESDFRSRWWTKRSVPTPSIQSVCSFADRNWVCLNLLLVRQRHSASRQNHTERVTGRSRE
jgi:hypothetical protein